MPHNSREREQNCSWIGDGAGQTSYTLKGYEYLSQSWKWETAESCNDSIDHVVLGSVVTSKYKCGSEIGLGIWGKRIPSFYLEWKTRPIFSITSPYGTSWTGKVFCKKHISDAVRQD